MRDDRTESLFPGEWMEISAGFPALCKFFRGDPKKPIIVFVPGGGFLARIAYGHPGTSATDFLCGCLQGLGYSVLAQSYPSDHPAFQKTYPEMTATDWGQSASAVTAELIRRESLASEVVLVGWSMAGRIAQTFNRSATALGLQVVGFISLSAHAPLPGLAPLPSGAISLTEMSLWNVLECAPANVSYARKWSDELSEISGSEGTPLFDPEICCRHYFANCPINLRGEVTRLRNGKLENAIEDALADLGSLDFANHPLSACIAPTLPSDSKHALTDQATFAFLNARRIFERLAAHSLRDLPSDKWEALRQLMIDLPERLTRFQHGGHFFFVGPKGASETAVRIADLVAELEAVDSLVNEIRDPKATEDRQSS